MVWACRYADYAGDIIDDNFDYTHGKDFWKEKLDYTNSWLSAHISDANAIGKPLIVEEFGKAKSAKKVYTGELINSPKDGELRSASVPLYIDTCWTFGGCAVAFGPATFCSLPFCTFQGFIDSLILGQVRLSRPAMASATSSCRRCMSRSARMCRVAVSLKAQTSGICTLWALAAMTHTRLHWLTPAPWPSLALM